MTLDELASLSLYWARHPPVHELVAAYLGFKPDEPQAEITAADIARVDELTRKWVLS